MSDSEEFAEQIRLENLEKERTAAEAGGQDVLTQGRTRVDPDGTVFEWDANQKAWFPKIDDDFIARYQMSYGAEVAPSTTTSSTTASSSTTATTTITPASDPSTNIPSTTDPYYAYWYYNYYYSNANSDTNTTTTDSKAYAEWYKKYYEQYQQQATGREEKSESSNSQSQSDTGQEKGEGDKEKGKSEEKSNSETNKEGTDTAQGNDSKDSKDAAQQQQSYDDYYKYWHYYQHYYQQQQDDSSSKDESSSKKVAPVYTGNYDDDYWAQYYHMQAEGGDTEMGEEKKEDKDVKEGTDVKEDKDEEKKEGDASTEGDKDSEKAKLKRKKPDPVWFEMSEENNTNVYVSGLPADFSMDEYKELMNKCGLVMFDPISRKPKLKLYKDKEGNNKGDGLCCYIKAESVELALQILDGSDQKGNRITVEKAKFQLKGSYDPSKKKRKLSNKQKKKFEEKQAKLFDWRPDKPRGARSRHERIVIVKNIFNPADFDSNPALIKEVQTDLQTECAKYGDCKKVVLHDRHPEGVATVTFREPEDADVCIEGINGRFFARRQITAETWDGKTKYHIEETDEEKEARLKQWDEFLGEEGEGKKGDKKGESSKKGGNEKNTKSENSNQIEKKEPVQAQDNEKKQIEVHKEEVKKSKEVETEKETAEEKKMDTVEVLKEVETKKETEEEKKNETEEELETVVENKKETEVEKKKETEVEKKKETEEEMETAGEVVENKKETEVEEKKEREEEMETVEESEETGAAGPASN